MEKVNVTRAARNFSDLLNRVQYQGLSFELERNNRIVARLVPARPAARLQAKDLMSFLDRLPPLGDDAEPFARDVEALRKAFPHEEESWA